MNGGGIWQSSEQWNFQEKDGLIMVENTSKNKLLAVNKNDEVIKVGKDEAKQLWVKGKANMEGFFTLKIANSTKVLTAIIESKCRHAGFTYGKTFVSI